MEVSIVSSRGVPPGAFVSLGVHQQRVMKPLASEKPCRFAAEDVSKPGVLKVEVLAMTGSARVIRQPGAHNYTLSVPVAGGKEVMELELAVAALDGAPAPKTSVPEPLKNPTSKAAKTADCQRYLDEHKFTDFLQALVKDVLEERPADPYKWIAQKVNAARPPVANARSQAAKPSISIPRRPPPCCGGACVVTGPSGVGKSTLIKKLTAEFPGKFGFSVSHTTREPRPGEQDGVDYHFVTRQQIERDIAAGLFIEHAEVHGNYYGTSFAAVESVMNVGKVCLLDIDVQGAEAVRHSALASKTSFVFFAPPTVAVLEQRLRGRGTETEERVQKRLEGSKRELAIYEAKPDAWDLTLQWFNEDVDLAYAEFRTYLRPQMVEENLPMVECRRPPPCCGGACVVTGPSGVGKSTLIKKLMAEFPGTFGFSVSHTTREPRPGEQDGVDYHFVSRERIERDIASGLFIEHAEVHGNYYGTSIAAVESVINQGKVCLLDIDVQGAASVRKSSLAPRTSSVFFAPPSLAVLERRLRGRGTETEERVQKRLAGAKGEMSIYEDRPDVWDLTLRWFNEDVESAYVEFRKFLAPQMPKFPTIATCTATAPAAAAEQPAVVASRPPTAMAVQTMSLYGLGFALGMGSKMMFI